MEDAVAKHYDSHAWNTRHLDAAHAILRLCGMRPEAPALRPLLEAEVAQAMGRAAPQPRRDAGTPFIPSPGGRRD